LNTFNSLKIALLIPKVSGGFRLESVPLNLSYLGAVLEQKGYFVKGYNLNFEKINIDEIKNFDIVGITSTTVVFPEVVKFIKRIKKTNPKLIIVVGGPHTTACPDESLSVKEIDYLVVGEGEISFPKLVEAIEKGFSKSNIPNLVYRRGGKIIHNKRSVIKDLDEIPFPAKHIFDISKYPNLQKAYGDIIASRGCPFKCTNCKPGLDDIAPYRLRKPEKVVDEMEWLMEKYKVRHFTFSDSELVGPKIWVKKFTSEIKSRNLRITYTCNGRTDRIDSEVLSWLKQSGCVFIGYGVESGSQEVIDNLLLKGINLNRTREVISETVNSGIGTGAWFMIGIPGETEKQLRQTISFAKTLDVSIIEINVAMPWPGTGFYEVCKKNGWLSTEDWGKMDEKHSAVIETEFLSAKRVKELFNTFRQELVASGWKKDTTGTRFFHPNFLRRTIKSNIWTVLHRGVQKGDFIKLLNWISGKY